MSGAESSLPADWFAQADLDLQAAEILLAQGGPLPVVAFHQHQTVEKYLKGFLLSTGWPLRRIHDLEVLVQEAIARDANFAPFLSTSQTITEYYIETRYPIGVQTPLQPVFLQKQLNTVRALIAIIRQKAAP